MLVCQSCVRRYFQKSTAYSIQTRGNHHKLRLTSVPEVNSFPYTPEQRKDVAKRGASTRHLLLNTRYHGPDPLRNDRRRSKEAELQEWRQSRGQTPAHKLKQRNAPGTSDKAMKQHLKYLGDPLKLGKDIMGMLRQDRFEEAIEIVRAASKNIPCIVSWNHLVDWQMSKGKVNDAVKSYNEMKKRAQHPDNHTFTILFRGFAAHAQHYPTALGKALAIYQSMTMPNSRVKPNKTHTNAILKVCARAGDMDALFGIAAKLPDKGFRAADNFTFTVILNGMRQHEYMLSHAEGRMTKEEVRVAKNKVIIDARRMWGDIIGRWRKADLFIDEELTCAMGRLLLSGDNPKDWDDVFSLLQQTMNIARPFGELGTQERDRHEPSTQSQTVVQTQDTTGEQSSINDSDELEENDVPGDEFGLVTPPLPNSELSWNGGYVRPGPNTVSLAMEALQKSSMKRHIGYYWDVFTKQFHIKPDRSNYAAVLRVLRLLRASSGALEVLMEMDRSKIERKHFRLALSACDRNKNNPHAFASAGKMLDLMEKSLEELDVRALCSYLSVAMASSAEYNAETVLRTPKAVEEKFAIGRRIQRALFRLEPCVVSIRSYLSFGTQEEQSTGVLRAQTYQESRPSDEYVEDAEKLFRAMISAYDKLLFASMSVRAEHAHLKEQRSMLSALVGRMRKKGASYRDRADRPGARRFVLKANDNGENVETEAGQTEESRFDRRQVSTSENEYETEGESPPDYNSLAAEEDRLAAERIRHQMSLQ